MISKIVRPRSLSTAFHLSRSDEPTSPSTAADIIADIIKMLRDQIADLEQKIVAQKAKLRQERGPAPAPKKAKPAPVRKQSTASAAPKRSPGVNGSSSSHANHGHGNGHAAPAPQASPVPKKPRKSKDVSYKDDDGGYGDSDEEPEMSMTQKQELAEKIQVADGDTLSKAIKIIQTSTGLDGVSLISLFSACLVVYRLFQFHRTHSGQSLLAIAVLTVQANDEIELDIDTLPPKVVSQLYNLVCRGGAPRRNGPGRPKGQAAVVGGKKPGRKATGGYGKRMMNEQEEAARIARMEAQLQSFDAQPGGQAGYESESSEEDESEEE